MKNPIKSVKNLSSRFRRKSRKSDDSLETLEGQSGTGPESGASSTTPSFVTTPVHDDHGDVLATFRQQAKPPEEKKTNLLSGVLAKGKETVTQATTAVNSIVTPVKSRATDVSQPESENPPASPEPPAAQRTPLETGVNHTEPETSTKRQEFTQVPTELPLTDEIGTNKNISPSGSFKESTPLLSTVDEKARVTESVVNPEAQPVIANKPAEEQKIYDVHFNDLLKWTVYISIAFWLMVGFIFGMRSWETTYYCVLAYSMTIGYCYLHYENVKKKKRQLEALNIDPGVDGLKLLVKHLPTWLSYTNKERVEWLNKALLQMWPSYDKAVCAAIKDSVEPIVMSVKPPIFKEIRFSRLKFGDAPFRIEGVEIYDITENEIVLDFDIRWSGDANITLAIEPNLPSMTEVTRMAPKVTNISCYGTLRLIFKPLVSEMPGFGAVVATFVRPPTVNFNCDFGKALGGGMSGNLVQNALDSLIRDTLINLYVWPQRTVIPMIHDENVTGPIDDLELRNVGVLTVKILEAKDLPAKDMNGFSDPTIEIWTRPERKFNTAVRKKTLNPCWENEVHNLLVQEPRSQNVSVTAYDVDFFNASDMLKSLNVVKNLKEAVNAKEFLGRSWFPVRRASENPGVQIEDWYEFGTNNFGHLDGPGTGCGSLHLKMVYTPFSMLKTENSSMGAVLATIVRCRDLVAMDRGGTSDPYVKVDIQGITRKTHVVNASLNPEFHVNFEFFDVPITEVLRFSVFDKDFITRDDPIGSLAIPLVELAKCVNEGVQGFRRDWFKLKNVNHGDIQLRLQYIPMDITPCVLD